MLAGHLAKCQEFAADPRGFLLLHGSVGGGKTFLAVAIARALLRRLKTLFISHAELLRRHRLTYLRPAQGEDRPKDIIAACQSAGLLILDDLGRRREGRDEDAVLHEVLNYRYVGEAASGVPATAGESGEHGSNSATIAPGD